jgi:hypothetical protein
VGAVRDDELAEILGGEHRGGQGAHRTRADDEGALARETVKFLARPQ